MLCWNVVLHWWLAKPGPQHHEIQLTVLTGLYKSSLMPWLDEQVHLEIIYITMSVFWGIYSQKRRFHTSNLSIKSAMPGPGSNHSKEEDEWTPELANPSLKSNQTRSMRYNYVNMRQQLGLVTKNNAKMPLKHHWAQSFVFSDKLWSRMVHILYCIQTVKFSQHLRSF